jgi:hypothetical protein
MVSKYMENPPPPNRRDREKVTLNATVVERQVTLLGNMRNPEIPEGKCNLPKRESRVDLLRAIDLALDQ